MSDDSRQHHFQALLRQVQHGSPEAARELYDTYVNHVLRGVRVRLWHRMRSKYDSQDFVQQVWASFFDEPERLPDFESPGRWSITCWAWRSKRSPAKDATC